MNVKEAGWRLIENIEKVIVGKRSAVRLSVVAFFSEGHILVEDVPGVAKTMLARSLAVSVGGAFKRIQCTPDLLPSDITGVSVFNEKTGEFEFRPGPVMANVVLADEINRATPRTQSALLECMAERQVTVDGATRLVPSPFMVLATQNPIEYEGTFPLPEAQLDRFLIKMTLGYPSADDESEILRRFQTRHPVTTLEPVLTPEEALQAQEAVKAVHVSEPVRKYIVAIVQATRSHAEISLGASPRASLALLRSSQALAAIEGMDYVLPDYVKMMAPHVLSHRLILRPEARLRGRTASHLASEIPESVPAPVDETRSA
jgi:MoxR-like ATPase